MKKLPMPTPTPIPVDWIYKAMPFLQGIPQNVIWGVVGSVLTVLLHYIYGLVTSRRIMTVEIAMKNSLHENQMRIERLLASNRERWDNEITEQMIELVKLTKGMERLSEDMRAVIHSVDLHGKQMHRMEMRMNQIEGKK